MVGVGKLGVAEAVKTVEIAGSAENVNSEEEVEGVEGVDLAEVGLKEVVEGVENVENSLMPWETSAQLEVSHLQDAEARSPSEGAEMNWANCHELPNS